MIPAGTGTPTRDTAISYSRKPSPLPSAWAVSSHRAPVRSPGPSMDPEQSLALSTFANRLIGLAWRRKSQQVAPTRPSSEGEGFRDTIRQKDRCIAARPVTPEFPHLCIFLACAVTHLVPFQKQETDAHSWHRH